MNVAHIYFALSLQCAASSPVNAYDKNGLKIVIHTGKERPREDVLVMVVSVVSTNTVPVKGFVFQAAVPKVTKKVIVKTLTI